MNEEPFNPTVVIFSQCTPPKPAAQVQVKLLFCKSQVPLFLHGLGMQEDNSSSQYFPVKLAVQVQLTSAMASIHVALFWHGLDSHSSMLLEQFLPVCQEIKDFRKECSLSANRLPSMLKWAANQDPVL